MDVNSKVTLLSTRNSGEDIIVETNQLRPGLYVGRTLLPTSHHDVKICVANTTSKPQLINAGSCLGQVMSVILPINKGGKSTSDQIEPPVNIVSSTLETLPTDLTNEQRQKVVNLLREYDCIFSIGTFCQ